MIYRGTILFLGPEDSPLIPWLRHHGEIVVQTSDRLSTRDASDTRLWFLISYGYKHILSKAILDLFPGRAINLHISLLPWGRGLDPNLHSFAEGTPKGVTIHYMDEGIDTGDIIAQKDLTFDVETETLATSYQALQTAIQDLFSRHWGEIKSGACPRQKQIGKGSFHRASDKDALSHLLTAGWDTPVSVFDDYAAETQMSKQFWGRYDSEVEELNASMGRERGAKT